MSGCLWQSVEYTEDAIPGISYLAMASSSLIRSILFIATHHAYDCDTPAAASVSTMSQWPPMDVVPVSSRSSSSFVSAIIDLGLMENDSQFLDASTGPEARPGQNSGGPSGVEAEFFVEQSSRSYRDRTNVRQV